MVHLRGCRSVCDAEPKWPHMNNLGDVRQQKQLVCGWEQAPWPELRDLGAGFGGWGGAHMGLLEVLDLLWGRARRDGESWDGAPLPLSACDADRKGLLCGRSWDLGFRRKGPSSGLTLPGTRSMWQEDSRCRSPSLWASCNPREGSFPSSPTGPGTGSWSRWVSGLLSLSCDGRSLGPFHGRAFNMNAEALQKSQGPI